MAGRRDLCDPASVRRVALLVFLALLTFDVSGLSGLCDEADCDEPCPTDLSGGRCPPNCHDCSCCSLPRVTTTPALAFIAPPVCARSWIGSTDHLPAPEPAEILHVPRSSLA